MGVWVGGLAVVVGVGVLGGRAPSTPDVAPSIAADVAVSSPAPIAATTAARFVLVHPSGVVTTPELVVSGRSDAGVDHVAVILQSRTGKPLSMTTIPAGPAFAATLPIPVQRDGTPLDVRVIAYDAGGIPVDVVGRRVVIGPTETRSIGGDGFVGGIVFDAPWEQRRGGS